jgi:glycosyltransferase involved in cell wall biosynthesis
MNRILHVIDTTGPGGAETVFVELADRLRTRGYESIALLRGPGWVRDTLAERGVRTEILDAKGSFNTRYLAALRLLIKSERIDVIQSHLLGSNVYCAAAGWLTGRPVVATFHGSVDVSPDERFRRLKFGIMNHAVSHFVAVSDSLGHEMREHGIAARKPVAVIYNGVDMSRYDRPRHRALVAELGLPEDSVLIGSLGNVRPAKAYDVLIRAAGLLCAGDPRLHFVIAGHVKENVARPLHALIRELNLDGRVHFLGFRPDTAGFLAGVDVFALSSSSEGFSIATIEAQAAGLPVVATRSGGPEEIITDRDNGLLVPVNDPQMLTNALQELLDNPALAANLAIAGRESALAQFSIEAMLDGYEAVYGGLQEEMR